jgi:hypothetical protein
MSTSVVLCMGMEQVHQTMCKTTAMPEIPTSSTAASTHLLSLFQEGMEETYLFVTLTFLLAVHKV